MREIDSKIVSRQAMKAERERLRKAGKKLVFTNGAFDILHAGHVTYLEFARQQGDALIVGLNSDASVKRYKGEKRPINPEGDRAKVLAALECVDYVVIFEEDEPKELIAELIPDVLVKGKDWSHYVSGREIVEKNGGKVVLADMVEGRSTTQILRNLEESSSQSQSSFKDYTGSCGHEQLDVYRLEQDFLSWCQGLLKEIGRVPGDLRNQLERSSLSMALNTAEGNGKRERPLRARFFDDARGSAAESAACLDAVVAMGLAAETRVEEGKVLLNRVAAMLTRLVERYSSNHYVRESEENDYDGDSDFDRDKSHGK